MAKQDEQNNAPSDSMTPQQRPQVAPAPAQPTRDPYAMGPTNYESFSRAYDSNAATAQQGAKDLSNKVSGEAQQAQGALQQAYGGWASQIDPAEQSAEKSETPYSAPAAWTADSALQEQYSKAGADVNAIGGTTGQVQALMGPHASAFGAALTRHAGQQGAFQNVGRRYSGLRRDIGAAQQNSTNAIEQSQQRVTSALDAQHEAQRQAITKERAANYGGGDGSSTASAGNYWDVSDQDVRAHELGVSDRSVGTGHYDENGAWVEG